MAKFIGTEEELKKYFGNFFDEIEEQLTSDLKRSYGNICVGCGSHKCALERVHAKGYTRDEILRMILGKKHFMQADGEYFIGLGDLARAYREVLEPADEYFYFLCPDCRKKYENGLLSDEDVIVGRIEQYENLLRQLTVRTAETPARRRPILKESLYQRDDESVQAYVQRLVFTLYRENLLNEELLQKLQDKHYCKQTFGIQYPLLEQDERKTRPAGHSRYYQTFKIAGKYFLCSQWWKMMFPEYRYNLRKWVDAMDI